MKRNKNTTCRTSTQPPSLRAAGHTRHSAEKKRKTELKTLNECATVACGSETEQRRLRQRQKCSSTWVDVLSIFLRTCHACALSQWIHYSRQPAVARKSRTKDGKVQRFVNKVQDAGCGAEWVRRASKDVIKFVSSVCSRWMNESWKAGTWALLLALSGGCIPVGIWRVSGIIVQVCNRRDCFYGCLWMLFIVSGVDWLVPN